MPGLTLRSVYSSNSVSILLIVIFGSGKAAISICFLFVFFFAFKLLDRLVLMYNDETPNGTSSESLAHAKGVVAFDGESGFWMTHSIPRFPPLPKDGYSYPSTGTRYGQTMLCVSLDFKQADLVGKHSAFTIFRLCMKQANACFLPGQYQSTVQLSVVVRALL